MVPLVAERSLWQTPHAWILRVTSSCLGAAISTVCMEPYVSRLHSFISLGGTHLGYTFGNNSILSSAMWVYQRWTKSQSLRQLNLKDAGEPKQGFVHSLAQKSVGLSAFKHVVLVASGQDRYAPFFSARIQIAPAASEESAVGSASIAMAKSLLEPVAQGALEHLLVSHAEEGRGGVLLIETAAAVAHVPRGEGRSWRD